MRFLDRSKLQQAREASVRLVTLQARLSSASEVRVFAVRLGVDSGLV